MNTEGCPPGKFTDEILVYFPTPFSCDSDIASWLGLAIFFVAFRVVILGLVYASWCQQTRTRATASMRRAEGGQATIVRKAARFPLIPFLSTLDTISLVLIVTLSSTNAINGPSGTTMIMFLVWMFMVCAIQFSTLKKMVGLGVRIFRFDRTLLSSSASSQSAIIASISNFDQLLKVLWTLMLMLLPLVMALAIAGAVTLDYIFAHAVVGLLMVEQALLYSSMMYQYQRCIQCVRTIMQVSCGAAGNGSSEKERTRNAFQAAISKMRYQQCVMFLTGLATCALLAYFLITLQVYWWLVVFCLGLDCFIYFSMVLSFFKCSKRTDRKLNPPQDEALTIAGAGAGGGDSQTYFQSQASSSRQPVGSTYVAGDSQFMADDSRDGAAGSNEVVKSPHTDV